MMRSLRVVVLATGCSANCVTVSRTALAVRCRFLTLAAALKIRAFCVGVGSLGSLGPDRAAFTPLCENFAFRPGFADGFVHFVMKLPKRDGRTRDKNPFRDPYVNCQMFFTCNTN